MSKSRPTILDSRYLNGWGLFTIIVGAMSVAIGVKAATMDLANPRGVSHMIAFSVRLAVPWLFLAFAASSLFYLLRGPLSRWLLRNRRIIGLCFAAGMAWQLYFILWLVVGHFDYYMSYAYAFHDLVEQVPGYMVLAAMTLTSFPFGRKKLTPTQWKYLHKGGIYFLWAVVFSTYWYELNYYDDVQLIDYVYFWCAFAAWGIRLLAWSRRRVSRGVAA